MTLDWIKNAISEDAPAGPNLMEEEDSDFDEYFFDAADRIPEPEDYFLPDEKSSEDRASDGRFKVASLKTELSAIDGLLRRSRDLRLLALRAQWSILAGDLENCVISVEAMGALLAAMPEEAHPVVANDTFERLDAIHDLTQKGSMLMPLVHLDIAGTGTSLRKLRVSRGELKPQTGETDLNTDLLLNGLIAAGDKLDPVQALLVRFKDGLGAIEAACLTHRTPHTPRLQTLNKQLDELLTLIGETNPDLAVELEPEAEGENEAEHRQNAPPVVTAAPAVVSADDAQNRLMAVEAYFRKHEPSSAAVLLVTQARVLIGKSLIDAFDMLMPENAPRASVGFMEEMGFKLAHGRLRELADQLMSEKQMEETQVETAEAAPSGETDEESEPVTVENSSEASGQLLAVETHFRAVERSSPVPLLLARARSYIGKDFETLMKEFVPKSDF